MAHPGTPIDESTKKLIAKLAADGLICAEICRIVGVSKNTVKKYSAGVFVPAEKKQKTHQEKGESCVRGNNKNCIDGVIFFRDDVVQKMADDDITEEEEKFYGAAIKLMGMQIRQKSGEREPDGFKKEYEQSVLHEFGDGQRRKGDVVRNY